MTSPDQDFMPLPTEGRGPEVVDYSPKIDEALKSDRALLTERGRAMVPPGGLDGKAPCPECGNYFVAGTGLGVHRKVAHGVQGEKKNRKSSKTWAVVNCPDCGKRIGSGSLTKHRKNVHRIDPDRPGRPSQPLVEEVVEESPVLSAGEVLQAIASMLWPQGIPHSAVPAMLHWYHATEIFLSEVR